MTFISLSPVLPHGASLPFSYTSTPSLFLYLLIFFSLSLPFPSSPLPLLYFSLLSSCHLVIAPFFLSSPQPYPFCLTLLTSPTFCLSSPLSCHPFSVWLTGKKIRGAFLKQPSTLHQSSCSVVVLGPVRPDSYHLSCYHISNRWAAPQAGFGASSHVLWPVGLPAGWKFGGVVKSGSHGN